MHDHEAAGFGREMDVLTAGLRTKSDKIRRLGRAGFSRQQIADYLGIRYQHVRNVLVDEERRGGSRPNGRREATPTPAAPDPRRACRLDIGPDGEVRLPRHVLEAAGTGPGKHLLVRFDDDEIKLVTPEATTRKIHAWVRKVVPEGESLVDDLRDERLRAFEREERAGRI